MEEKGSIKLYVSMMLRAFIRMTHRNVIRINAIHNSH